MSNMTVPDAANQIATAAARLYHVVRPGHENAGFKICDPSGKLITHLL